MKETDIFDDLFVLELARNHWGSVERGKEIIRQYAEVVKKNNVRAAIKLQAFDTDNFIHKDFLPKENELNDGENNQAPGSHTRYIKKTLATKLTDDEFAELVNAIRDEGLVTMVTPYDERSVDLCGELDVDVMKLASSDTGSINLVKKVVELGKPMSISTGAVNLSHVDRIVEMAAANNVPLLINQCVSNYPSDDEDLQMNQIDFWKARYPDNPIGFSSHDYVDITRSHIIAVAKGAVSFERHIDIQADEHVVQKYCIVPEEADEWFRSHHVAKAMCGNAADSVRTMTDIEAGYIKSVNRGAYALRDLEAGYEFTDEGLGTDYFLAIPLQEGQLASIDLDKKMTVKKPIKADQPLTKDTVSIDD
tara:strand:- start:7330 stop:8421 length:1092 start_codon:yes stop_codon:yes gene_type:complete